MAMRYTFAGLPDDAIRDMAGENAVRVYGLDREELAKIAARIGAPTLTELGTPLEVVPEEGSAQAFRTVGAWS